MSDQKVQGLILLMRNGANNRDIKQVAWLATPAGFIPLTGYYHFVSVMRDMLF